MSYFDMVRRFSKVQRECGMLADDIERELRNEYFDEDQRGWLEDVLKMLVEIAYC